MKKRIGLVVILIFVIVCFNSITSSTSSIPQPSFVPSTPKVEAPHNVYVGAWVGGSWDNNTKTLNVSVIKKFEQLIGKKLAIVNMYTDWTYLPNPLLLVDMNKLSEEGTVPMLSSNPLFFEQCPKKDKSLYKAIADGDCDVFLKAVAKNLSEYRKPVMLRFAWEMNLSNMYWSTQKLGSTPSEFVMAWRHFFTITKENASNIIWVLSFNTSSSGTTPYKELYPGDQYVDWVAIDGYNWGNSHSWSGWSSFDGTFKNSYKELTAITDKPVMLSEVNSAPNNNGGDKTLWLTDMLEKQIPTNYKQVKAIIFFNENKQDGESVDWRLEKSSDYLTAVKKGLSKEMYLSTYP